MTKYLNKTITIFSGSLILFAALFVFNAPQAEAAFNVSYTYKGQTITVRVNTNAPRNRPDVQKAIADLKHEANRIADSGGRGQITTRPSCGNTHKFNIGGTSISGGSGGSRRGGGERRGGGNGGGTPAPAPTCTHYSASAWGACTGYDEDTGQGGTQTRTISSSTGGCPGNSSPSTSKGCNIPFDFSLAAPSSNGEGQLIVGDSYNIEAVFVGDQQLVRSSSANISVATQFINHPDLTDLDLSVESVSPEIIGDEEYFLSDATLSPAEYATGTLFSVDVPRTNPGLYVILVNIEGGGLVRTATVNLTVRIADPSFIEI